MKNLSEIDFNEAKNLSDKHIFSDSVIVWFLNESLYRNVNLPCMVYLCILAVLGIFGNSIIIYIYGFRFNRSTAHFFILCLAVFDNLCCAAITMEIFDKRFPMYSGNYKVLCKLTRSLEVFGTVSSSMLLLCIALDRYYKVCKPFKSFTYHKARKCLVVSVAVGVLLCWPMILFKGPETVETGVKGVVGSECGEDDSFKHSVYPTIYFSIIGILNIIVILLLAVMYIRIFRAILRWKERMRRQSISSHHDVISSSYKEKRISSWIKKSKPKHYSLNSEHFNHDENGPLSNKQTSNNGSGDEQKVLRKLSVVDFTQGEARTGESKLPNGENMHRTSLSDSNQSDISDIDYDGRKRSAFHQISPKDSINSNNSDLDRRKQSITSTNSAKPSNWGSRKSKIVTTNTVLFSIVTVIYIISYLPTVVVQIINSSEIYIERELPNTTRSILLVLNVSYFLNSVCNQYVYSAIDPAFRKEVKQMFTGS